MLKREKQGRAPTLSVGLYPYSYSLHIVDISSNRVSDM